MYFLSAYLALSLSKDTLSSPVWGHKCQDKGSLGTLGFPPHTHRAP